MKSVKIKGRWYTVDTLTLEEKIALGLNDEVKKELKEIPLKIKDKPCAKLKDKRNKS